MISKDDTRKPGKLLVRSSRPNGSSRLPDRLFPTKPKAVFLLEPPYWTRLYGPDTTREIKKRVDVVGRPALPGFAKFIRKHPGVEIVFAGWGTPKLDVELLDLLPELKLVLSASGSIRPFATEAMWERGIRVSSAHAANAIPVCEYVVSVVLLSLKGVFYHAWRARRTRTLPAWPVSSQVVGSRGAVVGLISLGNIGRLVAERLAQHEVRIIAHDPFFPREAAARLNIELMELDEVFARADVVSLHTPLLDQTRGMIQGRHFSLMKKGACFINTARGEIVAQREMISVLRTRPDLQAVLDVTWPEPPPAGSPLFTLPNVMLTPHLAGSLGNEGHRHGLLVLEELDRYLNGRPLRWEVFRSQAARRA